MRKGMVALLTGMSLLAAPAAYAEPTTLTGEVTVKYEKDTAAGDPSVSGTMSTFKLNIEQALTKEWSLYTRLAGQKATERNLADFNPAAYSDSTTSVASFDQFGVMYKAGELTYKIGRQDLTFGTEDMLFKRDADKIGKHVFVDGLSVNGKVGAVDLSAAAAREDNEAGVTRGKVYALRAGYSPIEKLNWGLTLGRYQNETTGNTNHWALDGTYEFDKSTFAAQYTKSSANADNKAYVMNWRYDFDGKTALSLIAFRMETNGAMGGQSEFDGDNKGFYYGLTHKLGAAAELEVVYKDQKQISDGKKNTKFETKISYSF